MALRKKVLHGLAWRSSVDMSQQVLQIVFTAILARLLTQADFGVVAMALLVTRFVRSMTQVGFGSAIIQNQEVTEAQISAIFCIHLAINFAITIACYFGADLAAGFFNEPLLAEVLKVLAWTLLISSFSFPEIILRKKLNFRGYSILELGSMVGGNVVGIWMAFSGFGIWSLVWRLIVQRSIFSLGIWPVSHWRPCWPCFQGTGSLIKFGLHMLASQILYFFSQNLAAIITGKLLGAEILGAFSIAYNLAIVPAQKVQSILTSVLMPAFSSIQDNLENFKQKIQTSLFALGLGFFPLMFGLSGTAESLVIVVYGEKWAQAGTFLAYLAMIGLMKGTEHLLRSVILSRGWSGASFRIVAVETMVSVPLLSLGVFYYGVYGVIVAYMAASFVAFMLTIKYTERAVGDSIFLRNTFRSLLASGLMFVGLMGISLLEIPSHGLDLLVKIIFGVSFYVPFRYWLLDQEEKARVKTIPVLGRFIK